MNRMIIFSVFLIFLLPSTVAFSESETNARLRELERFVKQLEQRVVALEAQIQHAEQKSLIIKPGNSSNVLNWRQLRMGMTEKEVERLLGSAGKVDASKYFITWYYNYPSGGYVRFEPKHRIVEEWSEP